MSQISEHLLQSLPLPLAQLLQRVANAKSVEQRHHNAYYLFEAALRLAASAQIGAYLSGEHRSESIDRELGALTVPSAGHWLWFLQQISSFRSDLPDAADIPLAGVAAELALKRQDLRACMQWVAAATEEMRGQPHEPKRLTISELFSVLVEYRNQVFGHGAVRYRQFYERFGELLLDALQEVLRTTDLLGGLQLRLARGAPREQANGATVSWYRLNGLSPVPVDPSGGEPREGIERDHLYLIGHRVHIPLYPLAIYSEDEFERQQVGFLNRIVVGGRDGGKEVRRVEYLDYSSGQPLREANAQEAVAALLFGARGEEPRAEQPPPVPEEPEAPDAPPPNRMVGDFEILGELGRGGMGVVYRACQRSLNREVALKLLPPALSLDPVALGRFQREVVALGRCDHPNVVRILAAGKEGETHYYAMEYVEGTDLSVLYDVLSSWQSSGAALHGEHLSAAVSSASGLTIKGRDGLPEAEKIEPGPPPELATSDESYYVRLAELMAEAAEGLAHLDEHEIIHRDVKPGNIMVTRDGRRAVVMDLGLALTPDQSMSLTRSNVKVLGTLRYMAPEQLHRHLTRVDHRADVYALGATLHELACLRPVYGGETQEELSRQKLYEEPQPPLKVNPHLPKDLATITKVAIQRRPEDRYQRAADLASDLRAFAKGEPISARPPSAWRYLRLFYQRRRPFVHFAAAALLIVVALTGGFLHRLRMQRDRAFGAEAAARRAERSEAKQKRQAQEARRDAEANAEELARQKGVIAGLFDDAHREAYQKFKRCGNPVGRLLVAVAARDHARRNDNASARTWRRLACDALKDCPRLAGSTPLRHAWLDVCFSPDGKLLAGVGEYGIIKVWDLATGREQVRLAGHGEGVVWARYSSDGATLISGDDDGKVMFWDVAAGKPEAALNALTKSVEDAVVSGDGRILATLRGGSVIKLWDVRTGEAIASPTGREPDVVEIRLSYDGETLALIGMDDTVRLVDVPTGKEECPFKNPAPSAEHGDVSRGIRALAIAMDDKTVKLWDVASQREKATLRGHSHEVETLSFSPDEATLATVGSDGTIKLWDVTTGRERATLENPSKVKTVGFSPDGMVLASGGNDGTIKLWGLHTGRALATLRGHSGGVEDFGFSADSKTLASASQDGTIRLWDVRTGLPRAALRAHFKWHRGLGLGSDRTTLPCVDDDCTIRLWDVATGQPKVEVKTHSDNPRLVCFSPDGRRAASVTKDRVIELWDLATGQQEAMLKGHSDDILFCRFSPDSGTLASVSKDHTIMLWDLATSRTKATLNGHLDEVLRIRFSPDSETIASIGKDGTIKLWDLATGQETATVRGYKAGKYPECFSPDSETLAVVSDHGTVKLLEATTGQDKAALTGHSDAGYPLGFSPDSATFAAVARHDAIKLWDVATGTERATLPADSVSTFWGQDEYEDCMSFSPDSTMIATGNQYGMVRLWHPATGKEKARLNGNGKRLTSVSFSPDGAMIAVRNWSGEIGLWDVANEGPQATVATFAADPRRRYHELGFSPDSTMLSVKSVVDVRFWDVTTMWPEAPFRGRPRCALCLSFSADGRTIAFGGEDGRIGLLDVATGRERAVLQAYTAAVTQVSLNARGTVLASEGIDERKGQKAKSSASLWDVVTGREKTAFPRGLITSPQLTVVFSPDSSTLAYGSDQYGHSMVMLCDVASGCHKAAPGTGGIWTTCASFSPDGAILALGHSDGTIKLWEVTTGKTMASLNGHSDYVEYLSFSRDGMMLASASPEDDTIRLWDIATGREKVRLRCQQSVMGIGFNADGAMLGSASWNGVTLWNVAAAREEALVKSRLRSVADVSFSSDGTAVALAGPRGHIELLSLVRRPDITMEEAERLTGHRLEGFDVAALPHVTYVGRQDFAALGDYAFAPSGEPPSESNPFLHMCWDDRSPYRWIPGVRRGEAEALYRLAVIRERQCKDGEAIDLHRRASAVTDPRQSQWAQGSRWRLSNMPWLRSWRSLYVGMEKIFRSGDYEGGMREYTQAEGLSRQEREELGQALASQLVQIAYGHRVEGAYDEAVRVLRFAAELVCREGWLYAELGRVLEEKGDAEGAIEHYRRAVELKMEEQRPYVRLGHLLVQHQRYDEAITVLRQWLTLSTNDIEARAELVNALCMAAQHEDAHKAIQAFLPSETGRSAEEPTLPAQDLATRLTDFASSHHKDKAYDQAEQLCRFAIALHPHRAHAHNLLGIVLKDKGDEEGAITQYRRAIEVNADASAPHHNLAMLLERRGMADEAIVHYRKSASLSAAGNEFARRAIVQSSRLLVKQGRRDEAMQVLQEWIKKDEKDAGVRAELVDMFCSAGRDQDARKLLQPFLAAEGKPAPGKPDLSARDLADRLTDLADGHRKSQAHDQAEKLCLIAIEAYPASANTYNVLGLVVEAKGDEEGAIAQYRRAIEVDADYGPPRYNLAMLLEKRGMVDEAVVHYRKRASLSEAGDDFARKSIISCSRLLEKLGRRAEAIEALEEWLKKDADHEAAREELAVRLCSVGRYEDCYSALLPLLASDTPHVKILCLGIVSAHALGEQEKARDLLQKLLMDTRASPPVAENVGDERPTSMGKTDLLEKKTAKAMASLDAYLFVSDLDDLLKAGIDVLGTAGDLARPEPDLASRFGTWLTTQAHLCQDLGKHEQTVRFYSEAAKTAPDNAVIQGYLGRELYRAGRYQEAMTASQRALTLDGNLAHVHANVGLLHVLGRDLSKAMPSYEKAYELTPKEMQRLAIDDLLDLLKENADIAEAHYALGFCYEKKGDKKTAVQHYEKYVQAVPEGEFARKAQKRIAELRTK